MIEIGRLCVKIAGRDAQGKCVIIDIVDNNYVLIDGQVRRKKCNIKHLEPLKEKLDIKKNASHDEIAKALKKLGIEVKETKAKASKEKPKKQRKGKPAEPKKPEEKKVKKEIKVEKKEVKAEKKESSEKKEKSAEKKEARPKKAKKE